MKKRVALIAPTGMLGSMVYSVLKEHCNLVLVYKDAWKLQSLYKTYGKSTNKVAAFQCNLSDLYLDYLEKTTEHQDAFFKKIGDVDVVINCAGIIIPYAQVNPTTTFFINSALPHILSLQYKEKLIQVTTDCVFSGKSDAPYDEHAPKNPTDLYGLTKSIGEPEKSLVLRTSFIGPEIAGYVSLLEWLRRQKEKTVSGYTNHFWNGITTKEFGNICLQVVTQRNRFPESGTYHIFSTDISKYDMLLKIKEKYNLSVIVKPLKTALLDRRLQTIYPVCNSLQIHSFDEMLRAL